MSGNILAVLPLGHIPSEDLQDLSNDLKRILGFDIEVLNSSELPDDQTSEGVPEGKNNKADRQYDVTSFMSRTRQAAEGSGEKYLRVIGVTGVDLYTPGMNFIFGQAEIDGKICVISTVRLKYKAYWLFGKRRLEQRAKFVQRMTKEAVHELGHTFGLHHCPRDTCVMHFSNTLDDTDLKSEKYCRKCMRKLDKILKEK
jgi:archaemetzincin